MKTIKKIIAVSVCICLIFSVCAFKYSAMQNAELELSVWIKMAESLLQENKTYISGLTEFEKAIADAKAGGNEENLTENLKSAWENLWYTVRTQVSVPDAYTLNKTEVDLGTHSSTKTSSQLKFEWKLPSGEDFWKNAVSLDFYAGGYIANSPNESPSANYANLSLKIAGSDEYPYIGSTYSITKKGFTPTMKQFTIPASYFTDKLSQNGYKCELLIFNNSSETGASNTITVGSLFVTAKYQEKLPTEPASISVDSGNISYGTSAVFSVPSGAKAYYTTDGTNPTEFSNKCKDGQEIAITFNKLKILTSVEGYPDSILQYDYALTYTTRKEILDNIETIFGISKTTYSQMSDTQLAANALVIEQGDVSDEKYNKFLNIANSFAVSSVKNIKSNDLREILKRSSKYENTDLSNYYDTQVLEIVKSLDVSTESTTVCKEFELVRKYIDLAITVTANKDVTGGSIEINGIFANGKEKVDLLLNPNDGYKVKHGSLMVYNNGVASIIPERVGFRNNTSIPNEFTFVMPENSNNVVVSVEFGTEDTLSPLGNIARAKRENVSKKDGLRLIYRCYSSIEIESYGIILTSKTTFNNMDTDTFDLDFDGDMTRVDSKDEGFTLYDKCNEYVDFSAMVMYEKDSHNKSNDIISRSYAIMKNGEVFYSDLTICSYNDLSNKILSGDKLIYGTPQGVNGKIRGVTNNNESFVAWNKTELEIETVSTDLNPYDDDQIAVDVVVKSSEGKKLTVPAFYDGNNIWKCRFVLPSGGFWKYDVVLKEENAVKDSVSGFIEVAEGNNYDYIKTNENNPTKFSFTDGGVYTPVGMNVAWQSNADDYISYIEKISAGGGNYMRMWLSDYGITMFNNIAKPDDYSLTIKDAQELDKVIKSAEENGVYLQIALFNHELFQVDKSWNNNPYNKGNNGYLNAPAEFWSDSRAIEDTKDYIRYIMARYGYSSSVLSFELCNEITSCSGLNSEIDAWCREISQYIKSFECYRPLVSSSCANPADSMLNADYLDFINLHIYNYPTVNDIKDKVSAMGNEKPVLISEIGVDYNSVKGIVDANVLRQNIWSGIMSGSAGGAASWYWEAIDSFSGYNSFGAAMNFAKNIPFNDELTLITGNALTSNIEYMGYSGEKGKWIWIYDANSIATTDNVKPVDKTYNQVKIYLSGFSGTYTLDVYDTVNGNVIESKSVTANLGYVSITLNNFSKDTAVAIYKN